MHTPVFTFSPRSILKKLRYLEWVLIVIHVLLTLTSQPFEVSNGIPNDEASLGVSLFFYGIFAGFSFISPIHFSRWQRQGYILLAMLLILAANFWDVSLDLLIYLYIAKSFFLLGYHQTLAFTVAFGMAWILSECVSELKELGQELRFEPPFGFGSYSLGKIAIYSLGIYVAGSLFVILFSSVVMAEYRNRKRVESLSDQVETLATDLERTRIARDIHDSLGHTLTNLDIQLEVAQKMRDRDPKKASLAVDTAKVLSSQCIEDVSHAIKTMRQPDFNLEQALHILIEQTRSHQLFKLQWNINLPQLSVTISHHIYCVIKEGLINIQKHAQASSVDIYVTFTQKAIILKLHDDGIGFDATALNLGSGLIGMQERVNSLGGRLNISSSPQHGTKILVVIPR